jgi:hypothetical protein
LEGPTETFLASALTAKSGGKAMANMRLYGSMRAKNASAFNTLMISSPLGPVARRAVSLKPFWAMSTVLIIKFSFYKVSINYARATGLNPNLWWRLQRHSPFLF